MKFAIGTPFSFAFVLDLSEDLLDASVAYLSVVIEVLLHVIHEVLETEVARSLCVVVDGLGNLVLHLRCHIVVDGLCVLRHIVSICALMFRWSSSSRIHCRLFTKSIRWSGRPLGSSLSRIINVSVVGILQCTLFLTRSWRCADFRGHFRSLRIVALICAIENIQIWALLFGSRFLGDSLWRVLCFESGLSWRSIVLGVDDFFGHTIVSSLMWFVAWWSSCIAHSSNVFRYDFIINIIQNVT